MVCWCCVGLGFGFAWWAVLVYLLFGECSSVVGLVVWWVCFGSLMVFSFDFIVIMLVALLFLIVLF